MTEIITWNNQNNWLDIRKMTEDTKENKKFTRFSGRQSGLPEKDSKSNKSLIDTLEASKACERSYSKRITAEELFS